MCLSISIERPNDVLAKGEHLGFQWVVTHNGMGYRCGYVRVPSEHPWYGEGDSLCVDVHGGITFSEADIPCDAPGPDNAWWLGFDCAHAGDAPDPCLQSNEALWGLYRHDTVRTQEYVEHECRSLCEQAAAA
jgi:hypothetical protein